MAGAPLVYISIPFTRILDDHAEYGIIAGPEQLSEDASSSTTSRPVVWRRFRDFEGLRNVLSLSNRALPVLPPKYSWWTSRSVAVVNDRQKQLEFFLREVERRLPRGTDSWTRFCEFIGIDPARVETSSSFGASAPVEDDVLVRLQEENVRLKTNLTLLEEEEQRLREELARREGELANFREKKLDSKQTKEQVQAQIAAIEKDRNALQVEVAKLESLVANSKGTQEELRAVKEENTRLRTDTGSVESERSELRANLARLQEAHEGVKREVVRLQSEVESKQTLIKELEEKNTAADLQSELSRLKKERGELELEVARLETAQQSAAAYGANVLAKLEKAEKERTDLSSKLLTVTQQLAQATATIEAEGKIASYMRERVQELEKDLRSATQEITRLSAELDNANEGAENLSNEHEKLKRALEDKSAELTLVQKDLLAARTELAAKDKELETIKLHPKVDLAAESEIQALKSQLAEAQKSIDQSNIIKLKLVERVDALGIENRELKDKTTKLENRIKLLQGD